MSDDNEEESPPTKKITMLQMTQKLTDLMDYSVGVAESYVAFLEQHPKATEAHGKKVERW
jgi:hypothetical protein